MPMVKSIKAVISLCEFSLDAMAKIRLKKNKIATVMPPKIMPNSVVVFTVTCVT